MSADYAKIAKNRVILIDGTHASQRRAAVQALLEQVQLAEADALDKETIIAGERPFGDWIAAVSTIPFFSDRRCVIVRNILRIEVDKANDSLSITSLKSLPDSSLLILVADDEPSADERPKTAVNTAWRKAVKDSGGAVLTFEVTKEKNSGGIRTIAQKYGKKLSNPAASLLLEMVAGRTDRAEEEIQKLALFVGDSEDITEDDLKQCVSPEPEYNVWHMLDAMLQGDSKRALHQFLLIKSQTRDFRAEAQRMIPLLTGYFRTLWQARGYVEASGQNLKEWEPSEKGFSKTSDWQRDKNMRMARQLDFSRLLQCMNEIQQTHSRINGQLPGFTPEESMEQLILKISDICRRTPARA